ncbi:MAG TPA: hypothetical protein VGE31_00200 [Candidatus Paceibacterota bacterium]
MKKSILLASGAIAIALLVSGCDQARSQSRPQPASVYEVEEGDNLYDLTAIAKGDPELWRDVLRYNPFLNEPGRQFTKPDGTFVVLIRPGEQLRGLDELGIETPRPAVFAPPPLTAQVAAPGNDSLGPNWFDKNWGWLLLALLTVAALTWTLLRRRRNRLDREYRDPVGSGPAMVPGGVTDETVTRIFAERGRSRDFTIIGDVVRGRGYGEMLVRYANRREERRLLDGQVVYQATVRFLGANVDEQVFMLQGCGNDIRFGVTNIPGKMFRFVADETVTPAPQPPPAEPEAVAPAPTPEPELAPAPVAEAEGPVRAPKLKIELRPADGDKGSMVRVTGASTDFMTVELYEDELVLRHQPPTKAAPADVPERELESA